MNTFDAEMEKPLESIDSRLMLGGTLVAGFVIASGCLTYLQAAKTIV
jgi:hypothetical protein